MNARASDRQEIAMRLRITAEINRLDAFSAAVKTSRPRVALPHCIQNRPVDFRGMKDRTDPTVIDTTILR
jgi:hypothetical protein